MNTVVPTLDLMDFNESISGHWHCFLAWSIDYSLLLHLQRCHAVLLYSSLPQVARCIVNLFITSQSWDGFYMYILIVLFLTSCNFVWPKIHSSVHSNYRYTFYLNSFRLTLYGSAEKCCVSEGIYSLMHSWNATASQFLGCFCHCDSWPWVARPV